MDLLPRFYRQNAVLIGDSAHVFLSFTSQGVNSALQDVIILTECLRSIHTQDQMGSHLGDQEKVALEKYSGQRRAEVERYIDSGRNLAKRFLEPQSFFGEIDIPLVK